MSSQLDSGDWLSEPLEDAPAGECDMHLAGLAAGKALSLVVRKKNKKVTNAFPAFTDLYLHLKVAIKYIFDKKNKRFKPYKISIKLIGMTALIIFLPSTVRVAGAHLLVQNSLRSMHGLKYYATQCESFSPLCPTQQQWRQLAQFEAIMRPVMTLCFSSQSDRPEVGGEMVIALLELMVDYEDMDTFSVVDVDCGGEWSPDREFSSLPRKEMTISEKKADQNRLP